MACPDPHSLRALHRLQTCGNLKRAPWSRNKQAFFITGSLGVFQSICAVLWGASARSSLSNCLGMRSPGLCFRGIPCANWAPSWLRWNCGSDTETAHLLAEEGHRVRPWGHISTQWFWRGHRSRCAWWYQSMGGRVKNCAQQHQLVRGKRQNRAFKLAPQPQRQSQQVLALQHVLSQLQMSLLHVRSGHLQLFLHWVLGANQCTYESFKSKDSLFPIYLWFWMQEVWVARFRISGPKGCLRWTAHTHMSISSISVRSLPVMGKCTGVEILARRPLPPCGINVTLLPFAVEEICSQFSGPFHRESLCICRSCL